MAEEHDLWFEGMGITWFKSNPTPAPEGSDGAGEPGLVDKSKEKSETIMEFIGGENGVPGLDAYFTLVQNAGEVWKMGARVRKREEKELDDIGRSDPTSGSGSDEQPSKTKVAKTNTGAVTPDGVEQFMLDARNTYMK